MHCRVRYLLDFDLKSHSGQVCRINETTCFGLITLPDLMSYPRQTTFETYTQMSSITFRIYRPWLIPNLFQSDILSSFEKVKTLKSFAKLSIKPRMHLWEISILSLNDIIVRLTKIMNRADKNQVHF